jgi:phosphatidylglycerophosphatase A
VKVAFRQMADPSVAVALSFGLGLAPWMPGTFGAAGAFILYPVVMHLPWALQCGLALLLLLLGCVVCGRAARALGGEDPSAIVWDETVGMLITLVLTPATPLSWLLGFLAFRVLDINKPWLIGTAERRLRGGTAIMADDALAGLAAAGIVWAILAALARLTTA